MHRFIFLALFISLPTGAQQLLQVAAPAWINLTADEKIEIQKQFVIESMPATSFGIIVDNQGVDRSTPSSNAGSALGEAVGNAAYVDKALNSGNYSAKTHLGAMLLGGIIGSALNSNQQNLYQFRYTIKDGDGNITQQDSYSADPFRHPLGICVILPSVIIAGNQKLCTQTSDSLRKEYLKNIKKQNTENTTTLQTSQQIIEQPPYKNTEPIPIGGKISCKVGALAPIKTYREKCEIINGVIIND